MRRIAALALPTVAALAACRGASESPEQPAARRLALVDERISSRAAVWVPQAARVGVPFDVAITAVVGGECARLDGADVEVSGLVATVAPYVIADASCAGHAPFEARAFPVRFDRAGRALVRVRVRSAEAQGAETVVELPVTVTP